MKFLFSIPLIILFLWSAGYGETPDTPPEAKPSQKSSFLNLVELMPVSLEELESMPKNLSRWHMGASLLIIDREGNPIPVTLENNWDDIDEAVLLGDDETQGYNLTPGEHSIIINLGEASIINRIFLMSFSARGTIEIKSSSSMMSLDSWHWVKMVKPTKFKGGDRINFTIAATEGQYVHVKFKIEEEGEVGSLGVFGQATIAQTQFKREEEEVEKDTENEQVKDTSKGTISFDYASLYTGTEISHVSSGNLDNANQMIDDDFNTFYEFSPQDGETVFIVDLRDATEINRISLLKGKSAGRMEFYYLNKLPSEMMEPELSDENPMFLASHGEKTNPSATDHLVSKLKMRGGEMPGFDLQSVSLPTSFFDDKKPVFVKEVSKEDERIRFDLENMKGRFLLVRWIPSNRDEDQGEIEGLRIYELSIFGEIPRHRALLDRIGVFEFAAQSASFQAAGTPTDISIPETVPQPPPVSP